MLPGPRFFAGRVSDAGLPLEAGAAGPSRADSGSDFPLPVFEGVLRACGSPDLAVMFNLITRTLDFTQLQGEPPTCVAYGVSPALDELKMAYAGLPELLTATVEREMQRVPPCLARGHGGRVLAIEYLPGCGYLVKTSELLPADLQEVWSDFKSVFQETCEGRTVFYYRSNATEGLNESYGDLLFRIRDQEDAILQELVQSLLEGRDGLLVPASEANAPLDVLRAFAVVARDNAFCCPELNWDPGAPLPEWAASPGRADDARLGGGGLHPQRHALRRGRAPRARRHRAEPVREDGVLQAGWALRLPGPPRELGPRVQLRRACTGRDFLPHLHAELLQHARVHVHD